MITSSSLLRTLDLPDISQIGVIVKDMDLAVDYYEKTIGIGPFVRSDRDLGDGSWHLDH
jgi:hypothetical protein